MHYANAEYCLLIKTCELDEKQYKKFYHQIADLYIFGNDELIVLSIINIEESLTLHGPPHNDLHG